MKHLTTAILLLFVTRNLFGQESCSLYEQAIDRIEVTQEFKQYLQERGKSGYDISKNVYYQSILSWSFDTNLVTTDEMREKEFIESELPCDMKRIKKTNLYLSVIENDVLYAELKAARKKSHNYLYSSMWGAGLVFKVTFENGAVKEVQTKTIHHN